MSHYTVAVFTHTEDEVDELLAPFNEVVEAGSPYAEFKEDEDSDVDLVTGKKGYWFNPNARWDWYSIGGRWAGQLKLKKVEDAGNGIECCDTARVRDCDFSPDEKDYREAIRCWEIAVEGSPMTEEERKKYVLMYKSEYYVEQYGTKENYARHMSDFSTYAFITADGEWHETGQMGWFGMDDATRSSREAYREAFDAYLEEARKQDLLITIVDCHI